MRLDRGSHVVVADVDGAAAEVAATALGTASAATADVRDGAAVRQLVTDTVAHDQMLTQPDGEGVQGCLLTPQSVAEQAAKQRLAACKRRD